MHVNENPIVKCNLHGEDLATIPLVVVLNVDVQQSVKCKLDFYEQK
jgi:hypothetical protein